MNFSVVLIAKNEEITLPRLLGSLTDFQNKGGKILLLDTGSTDNTVNVAQSYGVEVHEVGDRFLLTINNADEINSKFVEKREDTVVENGDRLFDYSSARNYIAELAPTDFIFTPDCDEEFTKFDVDKIEELVASGVEQLEYNFVFSHDEYGNEAIKFMHSKAYDRRKLKWVGVIHEVLQGDAKRQFVDEDVIKLEHFQQPDERRTSYLKGLALDCFLNPNNERNSHYLGRELLWTKRPKSAIKELKRCISMHWWAAEKSASATFIGDAYGQLNKPELQAEWYNKAIYYDGSLREPFLRLARFYQHQNNPQLTACYVAAASELPWTPFYANNMAHYSYEPHEIMYWAKGWTGDINRAREELNKALEYKPFESSYLRDYRYYNNLPTVSFVLPHLGNTEARTKGLEKCLESIKALNYPQELIDIQVLDGEGTVPEKVKKMVDSSHGEYICYAANDMVFEPNSLILCILDSINNRKGLVAFESGVRNDEGYINEHFIIRRDLLPKIDGEVFDTEFTHVGVDDLLWKKCEKLGEAMIGRGRIDHHHFSRIGSGVIADEVIQKGYRNTEKDRALLKKKLEILYA